MSFTVSEWSIVDGILLPYSLGEVYSIGSNIEVISRPVQGNINVFDGVTSLHGESEELCLPSNVNPLTNDTIPSCPNKKKRKRKKDKQTKYHRRKSEQVMYRSKKDYMKSPPMKINRYRATFNHHQSKFKHSVEKRAWSKQH